MTTMVYLRSSHQEGLVGIGVRLRLSAEALSMLRDAPTGVEVTLTADVNPTTGATTITHVNGHAVPDAA